ncbi:fibronectin type III domain-containing protein [Streptomyces sp. NPDC127197]|uniref:fibronectin type III domain-containing protein n=1 Tax=Streptomyces sp. NPDC127197 TaxID=3345388 RepID=UPI00363F28E4
MNPARRTTAAAATAVVLATAGGLLTAVAVPASAATTCTSPVFKRQFFANTSFSGTPKKTDCDSTISQSWSGSPVSGVPSNNFGVRWSVTRDFGSGGPFTFTVSATDGVRVYLDPGAANARKIDLWKGTGDTARSKSVNLTIPSGKHTLRIDYVNWTGAAKVKFTYAPRTSATVDKVKPLAPTGASVTYDKTTGAAKATWAKNKEMDLAGYRVYRRLKGSSTWSKRTTTAGTSFTETLAKNGAIYYYEVRAYDKAGNESAGTAGQSVTTVDTMAPAAPTGVEENWAIGTVSKVHLYWNGNTEPDLAGYRVYRSTRTPVAVTPENLVSGSDPVLGAGWGENVPQTGDWYYYVVTAVDTHGLESAPSKPAAFETLDRTPPVETALNARATEDEAGVTISWDASEVSSGDDFVGYKVFRSLKPRSAGSAAWEVATGVKGTAALDPAPQPGTTYYYWVHAVDAAGNWGPVSQDVVVTPAGNTTAPAAVTGLSAVAKEDGVALSWDDASDEPGFDHYLVYRGTLVDGEWVYEPLEHPADFKPWQITATSHHDRTPADGEQVRYSVVAVDQYGNQLTPGVEAPVVDLTELDLRPTVPAAAGAPVAYFSAASDGWLAWALGADTNAADSPVTGFNIYRWNRTTGAYELIGTEPEDNSSTGYWLDRTMPAATTVYYRLTVVYADGTESEASEDVAVSY